MAGRMPAGLKAAVVALTLIMSGHQGWADTANVCFDEGSRAANAFGVPSSVMAAITLTETGRGTPSRPWPWAINHAGDSYWFDTRAQAIAHARQILAAGQRNFDVGCFQLNYRWHGDGFSSLESMFEPSMNANYAARFLARLYPETSDWSRAAGTYHSRTPVHATRYRAIFDRHLASLPATRGRTIVPVATPTVRVNWFPLLKTPATPPRLGSLVSIGNGQ